MPEYFLFCNINCSEPAKCERPHEADIKTYPIFHSFVPSILWDTDTH